MALTLMYITNDPTIARIAEDSGVDRVWIDMEYIGKSIRQGGMDTVQSHHTVEDIRRLRPIVTSSDLMVRVNPVHDASDACCATEDEIDLTVEAGADVIMLPYFKTADEVARFVGCVSGRAKTSLLFETAEAVENVGEILSVPGIDEVHIGLNDLHLSYGMKFMFELLCDGTVDRLCAVFRDRGIKYGFGGVARVGTGTLPAELIISEHYRLGSTAAILSRGFFDARTCADPAVIRELFDKGVADIREREREVSRYSEAEFASDHKSVCERVGMIVNGK